MPKVRGKRSYRSTGRRGRSRSWFPYPYIAVAIVIAGILIAWWTANLNLQQEYTVVGQPSINADFINRVLDHYHSPARGKGQALYDYGVKYGIDPSYALAFFMHESSFGTTGVARVTRSLGNIRASDGYRNYDGYRLYSTWEEGFEDWYKLISDLYVGQWKLTTVDQIVPVYAPSEDNNDVAAYIQAVKTAVDTWRGGIVQVRERARFLIGMLKEEKGQAGSDKSGCPHPSYQDSRPRCVLPLPQLTACRCRDPNPSRALSQLSRV